MDRATEFLKPHFITCDIQPNENQHADTQHNMLNCDTQHHNTQHEVL
jgi:hypothetical protein